MQIIIHRGTHEIGGSCVELKTDKARILIDFGMPLVGEKKKPFDSKVLIGKTVDDLKKLKILPDIRGLYNTEGKSLDAILISHSHMDHYGLLNYVHPDIPVYMSQGAKELIEISSIFMKISRRPIPGHPAGRLYQNRTSEKLILTIFWVKRATAFIGGVNNVR